MASGSGPKETYIRCELCIDPGRKQVNIWFTAPFYGSFKDLPIKAPLGTVVRPSSQPLSYQHRGCGQLKATYFVQYTTASYP